MAIDSYSVGVIQTEQGNQDEQTKDSGSSRSIGPGDVISLDQVDLALAAKMNLVNDTIDRIGFTRYHAKLFFLNGFGYGVDSLLLFLMSISAEQVVAQYPPKFTRGAQLGFYLALLVGALFWGSTADVIGRKWAFNFSLLISAVFAITAGAAPNYAIWAIFVAISAFGSGGNLVLDTTVFLEYLPSNKQWLLTLLAGWWGIGQTVAGLVAWGFMANYSCPLDGSIPCTNSNNMGWRYLFYTCGALVFVLSIARVLVIRFHETPKFLLCQGNDEAVVKTLQDLAEKHSRVCNLTLDQLQRCGQINSAHAQSKVSFSEVVLHIRGLFATQKMVLSTSLVWISWAMIGLGYALYYVYLPEYLASRDASTGESSADVTWRNYAITNLCAIPGPIIAAGMCEMPILGRKGTMALGAFATMAFFFGYTTVRTGAENLGFSCAISVTINIYYATLYAYTVEVLPSAHRGTGNGIAVALNRLMGMVSALIGAFTSTSSSVPIYVCAALLGFCGILAMIFPLESRGRRSI
ncbi:membrane transporter [Penicillium canescens]|uniref:Membrane transporter n=1 Tax=Penicillium canescens TaxID=5083 RepID=A0AAD6NAV8_PENCN|nr:membrane transporter [Penicillium canescens]KAJ6028896.1 membrane transporter [Penicillium canescens]KAJ6047329.1 membrane transporter [Penicillium canescens]KAJ6049082.1 membrane transporter [Penicillium canescens]